jgi:Coenzyme PQQ synthesis protein D (PqqD)
MLTLNHCLRPRGEEIASKVIDGEAIIINLTSGIYYSMDKAGGFIWEMIETGQSLQGTLSAIVARYDVSQEQAQSDIEQLVNDLLQENLVTIAENGAHSNGRHEAAETQKLPYETPKLNIYRDMGDLLALDPPTPGLETIAWKDPGDDESTR